MLFGILSLFAVWRACAEGFAFGAGRSAITNRTFWNRRIIWFVVLSAWLTLQLILRERAAFRSVDAADFMMAAAVSFVVVGLGLLFWAGVGYGCGRLRRGKPAGPIMLYVKLNDKMMGPYSWGTVHKLSKAGKISDETLVRTDDLSEWTPMGVMRVRLKK